MDKYIILQVIYDRQFNFFSFSLITEKYIQYNVLLSGTCVCIHIIKYKHNILYLYFIHNNAMCQCVNMWRRQHTAPLDPPKRVGKFNCTAFILLLWYLPLQPPLCRYYTDVRARPYCTRSRRVRLVSTTYYNTLVPTTATIATKIYIIII